MLTAPPERHTLLRLTEAGTDLVWANRAALYPGEAACLRDIGVLVGGHCLITNNISEFHQGRIDSLKSPPVVVLH